MSQKVIPQKTEVTCDVCHSICSGTNYRQSGALHIKRDGLDFSGHAVGDASVRFDLCDTCLDRVTKAINQLTLTIREEKKHE